MKRERTCNGIWGGRKRRRNIKIHQIGKLKKEEKRRNQRGKKTKIIKSRAGINTL